MPLPAWPDLLLLGLPPLWVFGVFRGWHRKERWLVGTIAAATLAGAVHVAVGAPRWGLLPLYLFDLGAAFVSALRLGHMPEVRPRWRQVVARTLMLAAAALAVLTPTWLLPIPSYERPTGPYQVGTRTEYWVDSTRAESFTFDTTDHRRLMVQMWYPGEPEPGSRRVRSHPAPAELATATAGRSRLNRALLGTLGMGLTWARADIPMSGAERTFPLLVFSHGFGGSRTQNGFQMAELASHGYVIVSADHTYHASGTRFPDGAVAWPDSLSQTQIRQDSIAVRFVNLWAADGRFLIDRMSALVREDPRRLFTGRIDTTRIGYFGHSFGGATAAQIMSQDPRVIAGLNMDGYPFGTAWEAGLSRPFLELRGDPVDPGTIPEEQLEAAGMSRAMLQALFDSWGGRTTTLTQGGGLGVHLRGATHMNFSDQPLWSPALARPLGIAGPVDVREGHRLINAVVLGFFDRHLKQRPAGVLDSLGQGPYALLERTTP